MLKNHLVGCWEPGRSKAPSRRPMRGQRAQFGVLTQGTLGKVWAGAMKECASHYGEYWELNSCLLKEQQELARS